MLQDIFFSRVFPDLRTNNSVLATPLHGPVLQQFWKTLAGCLLYMDLWQYQPKTWPSKIATQRLSVKSTPTGTFMYMPSPSPLYVCQPLMRSRKTVTDCFTPDRRSRKWSFTTLYLSTSPAVYPIVFYLITIRSFHYYLLPFFFRNDMTHPPRMPERTGGIQRKTRSHIPVDRFCHDIEKNSSPWVISLVLFVILFKYLFRLESI